MIELADAEASPGSRFPFSFNQLVAGGAKFAFTVNQGLSRRAATPYGIFRSRPDKVTLSSLIDFRSIGRSPAKLAKADPE
jgi:hypothetical protein